ncbi:MAG TPA: type II toxin-antitoxin system RelE/ParE family toxin [Sulfurovum sp.]|nr:type II toxin-antitoxin system RelE/ParE family toxin [Sulfurovum sp.]
MTYKLIFLKKSKKEWEKLSSPVRDQFKKKLDKRLSNPHVPHDKLSGFSNVYKIKLRSSGFRLAYEVVDERVIVIVLSVGKRENNDVYDELKKRMDG